MRASLALHLALFRRQKAQIALAVEAHTTAFRAYEARYRRRTASYRQVLPLSVVHQRVRSADVCWELARSSDFRVCSAGTWSRAD